MMPLARAIHSNGDSLSAYYLTGVLGTAAVVAWGMYVRGRRQGQGERRRRKAAEAQLRVEQIRHAERRTSRSSARPATAARSPRRWPSASPTSC
jgi:sRNA-binding protein